MRNIITIAVAVLIMAAAVPIRAQEWTKVNDTTYIRQFVQTNGMLTEYAKPVDAITLTMKINNDLRTVAACQGIAIGCGFAATAAAIVSVRRYNGNNKALNVAAVALGLAGLGFEIGGIDLMSQKPVYIAPDGVVIRLTRTEQPKPKKRR